MHLVAASTRCVIDDAARQRALLSNKPTTKKLCWGKDGRLTVKAARVEQGPLEVVHAHAQFGGALKVEEKRRHNRGSVRDPLKRLFHLLILMAGPRHDLRSSRT